MISPDTRPQLAPDALIAAGLEQIAGMRYDIRSGHRTTQSGALELPTGLLDTTGKKTPNPITTAVQEVGKNWGGGMPGDNRFDAQRGAGTLYRDGGSEVVAQVFGERVIVNFKTLQDAERNVRDVGGAVVEQFRRIP